MYNATLFHMCNFLFIADTFQATAVASLLLSIIIFHIFLFLFSARPQMEILRLYARYDETLATIIVHFTQPIQVSLHKPFINLFTSQL